MSDKPQMTVLYGPPEPVYLVMPAHGTHHYRIQRGAMKEARDAGDDHCWLTLTRGKEPILIAHSAEQLKRRFPTLRVLA